MDRHMSRNSPVFEDQDQNHNCNPEVPYSMGRIVQGNSTSIHHMGVTLRGLPYVSRWDSESRQNHHSSSRITMEVPHARAAVLGSSVDALSCPPAAGGSFLGLENNTHDAYANYYHIHDGVPDPITGRGRGPLKRKGTGVFIACDRVSMGRYFSAGSSSSSSEQLEEPSLNYNIYPPASIGLPHNADDGLSIATDCPGNVRNCPRHEVEPIPRGSNSTSYSSHPDHSATPLMNNSSFSAISRMNLDTLTHDRNCVILPPSPHRRFTSDASDFTYETNRFVHGGSSTEVGGHQHDSISRRNHVTRQYLHASSAQASREGRTNYSSRVPAYRAGPSYQHMQYESTSAANGLQPFSGGWHHNYRNRRSRMTMDRFEPLPSLVDVQARMGSEALLMLDRPNSFDQHMDMRLDIDNMSYEELLALGERIGNVSTGVSECMISKCLMVTCCYENQDEAICVICLENLSNKEKVGTLKSCGHKYHSSCIEKWLAIKNACPICKVAALSDSSKEE